MHGLVLWCTPALPDFTCRGLTDSAAASKRNPKSKAKAKAKASIQAPKTPKELLDECRVSVRLNPWNLKAPIQKPMNLCRTEAKS